MVESRENPNYLGKNKVLAARGGGINKEFPLKYLPLRVQFHKQVIMHTHTHTGTYTNVLETRKFSSYGYYTRYWL